MDSVLQAGVISAPLQVILDRLATLTVQETSLVLGVDEDVRKLRRTLERIKAMVGHVEENRSTLANNISNEAWKVWLEDVEALLYSADDLLDGISLDLSKHRANLSADADGEKQVQEMVLSSFKLTVPREISRIKHELEEIGKEMDTFYMNELTKLSCDKIMESRRAYRSSFSYASSSLVDVGSVVGRNREKNEIVEMLLDEDLNEINVSVVPIVGMGGIGKTTLAQLLYNNERIVEKFPLKMWASVSPDFDTICITKSIIESATGKICKLSDLDPVQIELSKLIHGKRFLLVLDDYWSEEYKDWDVLSSPLKFGAKGSKILLTTRSITVSRIVGTVPSYNLECLSDENCWEIVKQRASLNRTLETQLEGIGRMIAMKCKGLPLASKTLGSMLRFKDDPAEWISILESDIWNLPHDKDDIFPALTLSYYHLPAQLKKCFSYCSIFPKNYEFEMNELVLLWMAEGFIRPIGKLQLEDIGIDYFKNLLWRSFFQLSHVNTHGRNIYKMHDLIHTMAQLIAGHTCLHQQDSQCTFFRNTRHISLHCGNVHQITLTGHLWCKNLRTYRVISGHVGNVDVSYDLFLKLKSLRVLDLSHLGLHDLPDSIDNLKHLRYLNLSGNRFIMLPESLANLFCLQTLKLEQCFELFDLPRHMKNMVGLRHLRLDIKQLQSMPPEFGKLVNLQSLSAFIVGGSEGYGIQELKNMRFLRGCICIKNLENVNNVNEAKEAMLHMKPFLDRVELEWNGSRETRLRNNDEEILAGLHPHENLKELSMSNYRGFLLPGWFSSPLCKLSSIYLLRCNHYQILTCLGKLQRLKCLFIGDMSNWTHIDENFSGFPSLESLTIKEIPNLTSWELFQGSRFPCLRSLDIDDCPKLTNLPSLYSTSSLRCLKINRCPKLLALPGDGMPLSLQELVISDCDIIKGRCRVEEGADWYKIRSIPKIEIDYMEIDMDMRRF